MGEPELRDIPWPTAQLKKSPEASMVAQVADGVQRESKELAWNVPAGWERAIAGGANKGRRDASGGPHPN